MFRRFLEVSAVGLVAGLLILLGWNLLHQERQSAIPRAVANGEHPDAPSFEGRLVWRTASTWPAGLRPAAQKATFASSALDGRPVVLNFWASWCAPCKREADELAAAARQHAGKVVFLGVDANDFASDAHEFLRRYGIGFPSIADPGMKITGSFGILNIPETYFISVDGRLAGHIAGQASADALAANIALIAPE